MLVGRSSGMGSTVRVVVACAFRSSDASTCAMRTDSIRGATLYDIEIGFGQVDELNIEPSLRCQLTVRTYSPWQPSLASRTQRQVMHSLRESCSMAWVLATGRENVLTLHEADERKSEVESWVRAYRGGRGHERNWMIRGRLLRLRKKRFEEQGMQLTRCSTSSPYHFWRP